MGFIATATAAFCAWIVLWAVGAKSFDAFLLAIVIIILAAGWRIVSPNLPGNREH
jgi:hypothetical protein